MKIVYFGSLKTKFIKTGIERYVKWLKPYERLSLLELKSGGDVNREQVENIQKKERELLFKSLKSETLIVLDEAGDDMTSVEFASFIEKSRINSKELLFAIGGYTGFHTDVKKKAVKTISLSKMTFTHEMALLLLIEQIYRSMKILNGEKYHY